MFDGVVSFLSAQIAQMLSVGAVPPLKIKLGVTGLLGSFWPLANPFFGEPAALEDNVEVERVAEKGSREEIEHILIDYWTALRDTFGMGPPDEGRIAKAMQYHRS